MGANEQWEQFTDGTIRVKSESTICLAVSSITQGGHLRTATCSPTDAQQQFHVRNGTVQMKTQPQLCLTASSNPVYGRPISLVACTEASIGEFSVGFGAQLTCEKQVDVGAFCPSGKAKLAWKKESPNMGLVVVSFIMHSTIARVTKRGR